MSSEKHKRNAHQLCLGCCLSVPYGQMTIFRGEVFCQFQPSITSYVEALEKGKNRDSSTDEDSFPSTQQFQPIVSKSNGDTSNQEGSIPVTN